MSYLFYDPMDASTSTNAAVLAMQALVDEDVLNSDTLAIAINKKQRFVDSTFHAKRQAPITYTAGGGSHSWEASDESVHALVAQLASGVTPAVGSVNSILATFATSLNSGVNSAFSTISTELTNTKTQANIKIQDASAGIPVGANSITQTYPAQSISVSYGSVDAGANISWLPSNSATPLSITRTEAAGLIDAIGTRRASLMQTRMTLRLALAADTTIAAVAARDVNSMWAY